ncbi:OprD family outer membrane porin [Pantoea sp. Cy-639]|uniref:OprD family outer membrane porin n=1 Tax=Pantoea sp. Cy-639 TaxID=2608360 RepID=UPI00196497C0|nr:OprD family outer membrane porin [Pantoea sp. Cy-639]
MFCAKEGQTARVEVSAVTVPTMTEVARSETGERTWQLSYAYDFAVLGVPGLTFSTRHNHADHANPVTFAGEGREWERDTDLEYTIQSGPLKNVNVLWRNAALRSNYQRDIDENRLIISYTLPLF